MADIELHLVVRSIAKSFEPKDGTLAMSAEDVQKHLAVLAKLKPAEREPVAVHIVALAQRFRSDGGRSVDAAIALLIGFAVAAVGDVAGGADRVADMFGRAGMKSEARAAAAIGHTEGIRAPRSEDTAKPAAPAVKTRRGLKKAP